jgi:hypothetical protein
MSRGLEVCAGSWWTFNHTPENKQLVIVLGKAPNKMGIDPGFEDDWRLLLAEEAVGASIRVATGAWSKVLQNYCSCLGVLSQIGHRVCSDESATFLGQELSFAPVLLMRVHSEARCID